MNLPDNRANVTYVCRWAASTMAHKQLKERRNAMNRLVPRLLSPNTATGNTRQINFTFP
jgi:hypothetical protein